MVLTYISMVKGELVRNNIVEILSKMLTLIPGMKFHRRGVVASCNGIANDPTNIANVPFLFCVSVRTELPFVGSRRWTRTALFISRPSFQDTTLAGNITLHIMTSLNVFLDQVLLDKAEAVNHYTSTTQEKLGNSNNDIFSKEAELMDSVLEYTLLGDDITDGVFTWLSISINPNALYAPSPAVILTENGGVANSKNDVGGPNGTGIFIHYCQNFDNDDCGYFDIHPSKQYCYRDGWYCSSSWK
ncbi:hypothetical protein M422DRAFT_55214 [Sphaerobolus stellatus SS14]|uniref:Uncharacterized protein n=1 Tax=Sphaerobolus stellatus (strain SS14) TaxID=990650 RepID=A0A0C9UP46_SPHS4|nr:hypothetical protein M422DRAFT_55214 [Sphaerobolus stellatus SS14]